MRPIFLVLSLQAVLTLSAFGQSPAPSATALPLATPATATPSDEVRILKAEAADQKYYNDKIVGTFATLIQTAVGVFALLGGISWVSAVRLRQSERRELLTDIEERHTKVLSDYRDASIALLTDFESELEKFKKRQEESNAEFTSRIILTTDNAHKKVAYELTMLNHRLTFQEAERLREKGVFADALILMSACASLAAGMDQINLLQGDLVAMQSLLSAWAPMPIADGVYHQITNNLKNLPPQVANTLEVVIGKLKARAVMP